MTTTLNIHLFGRFSIHSDEQALSGLDAPRLRELLCYLLLRRGHPHPRETLASMLWGEGSTAKSKKYLRQALWHLKTALESQSRVAQGGVLLVEHDWVQFELRGGLSLDVAAFEQVYEEMRGVSGATLGADQVWRLEEAVRLYRGELLEGWYQDWCLFERERLHNIYLVMLDKLMSYSKEHLEYEMGLRYGALALCQDRARERTHRQLMYLHYMAGDRTTALRQYERCCVALKEELEVKPGEKTVALFEQIRSDRLRPAPPRAAADPAPPAPSHALLSDVLGRLKDLHRIAVSLQRHVRKDIEAVETALNERR